MEKTGFDDMSLNWFKSYFTRSQTVRFNNVISSVLDVKTGIGQGTILGPLMFIFYINDIIQSTGRLKINMYADDCVLYQTGNNWNRMATLIQPDLNKIQSWCNRNRLKLSVSKSKTLLLGSISKLKTTDYTLQLSLSGNELPFVDTYNYLGITLDKHMSLTPLVSDVKRKVLCQSFKLRKLRRLITTECALAIYKQTILPVLDYAGFILYSLNKSDKHDLQVIQNDMLRTCYNYRRRDHVSIKNLHTRAKLLSLDQRRQIQLLSLMFGHKCGTNVRRVTVRNTRAAVRFQFYKDRYNTVKYKNSPYYKGAELWDHLSQETTESTSLFEFKNCLKKSEITVYVADAEV